MRQLFKRMPGFIHQQLRFIVVSSDITRAFDKFQQFCPGKHRHGLPRVKNEGYSRLLELARMLNHAIAPVGRENAETYVAGIRHLVIMGKTHGAGMKGGDLVVALIGGDKSLRRV